MNLIEAMQTYKRLQSALKIVLETRNNWSTMYQDDDLRQAATALNRIVGRFEDAQVELPPSS